MHNNTAIIIPARLGSSRLKEKAIQMIGDKTMVEHTYHKGAELGLKHLYVATDSDKIANVIERAGGKVIMTSEDCQSGTDRVYEAIKSIENSQEIEYVVNLQGDLPLIDPSIIMSVILSLKNSDADIVTPVAKVGVDIAKDPNNVKAIIGVNDNALYFSRAMAPYGSNEYWYHIGIYGYKIEALKKFVELSPSVLEKIEKLEQLRALENDMKIKVCYADSIPVSVDTESDLEKVRKMYTASL
ncbi:MAG: 3-deoxy-manno-octulosonate cytidylyltransferase [Rickettsiaceae bacterium]|nr:3-deoxy-manno-octulosonate cytidylyltransferase [Rickettsiaceae bacterium]